MLGHASQIGHPAQELISDNGDEFDNTDVRKILHVHGINQMLTVLYTPK